MLLFYIPPCRKTFPAWRNVIYEHGRGKKCSGTNRVFSHSQNCNFPEESFVLSTFCNSGGCWTGKMPLNTSWSNFKDDNELIGSSFLYDLIEKPGKCTVGPGGPPTSQKAVYSWWEVKKLWCKSKAPHWLGNIQRVIWTNIGHRSFSPNGSHRPGGFKGTVEWDGFLNHFTVD